jgi:hypothetical protein
MFSGVQEARTMVRREKLGFQLRRMFAQVYSAVGSCAVAVLAEVHKLISGA